MIRLDKIQKAFGHRPLFDDVTFAVNRGERIGLVGRNGHGKTTLLRMIAGEESADGGTITMPRRYRIGYLQQHLVFQGGSIVEEVCAALPEDQRDDHWRAEKILAGLGFDDSDFLHDPAIFSGGYQVRINLARVLVSQPDLLLLDEPTNYLDVVSIRWLARFLRVWPSELILVTHDRAFMDAVVTHTVAIHRRRAHKMAGDTGKLYSQIQQEEEIYEKTRVNDEKKRRQIERFVTRFRSKNTLATRVQSRIKYLEKHKRMAQLNHISSLDFSFRLIPLKAKVPLRVERLSYHYDGSAPLFSGLSLDIHNDDRICVIGQNGRGKSTLLRILAGELTPREGQIHRHARLETGYFAQTHVDTLQPQRTVVEEILAATSDCTPQRARNIAGTMMFEGDDALKRIEVLSGGERSRVMLARLMARPCNLLLLDEPTNHLDMDACDALLEAIEAFDGPVVVVTHNEMFLRVLATRFVIFDRGCVRVFDRSYQEFLTTVGWELDERTGATRTSSAKRNDSSRARSGVSRKERARIVQERSRVIAPVEKRIARLETKIAKNESRLEEVTRELTDAAQHSDVDAIATLSREHRDLTGIIASDYSDLESASSELDKLSSAFDNQLDASS